MKENEQSPGDLWDTIKYPNIYMIGLPEEKKEKIGKNNI